MDESATGSVNFLVGLCARRPREGRGLAANTFAVDVDGVASIGVDYIDSRAAIDGVTPAVSHPDHVRRTAAVDTIATGPTDERVRVAGAVEHIVAAPALETILAAETKQPVRARLPRTKSRNGVPFTSPEPLNSHGFVIRCSTLSSTT